MKNFLMTLKMESIFTANIVLGIPKRLDLLHLD